MFRAHPRISHIVVVVPESDLLHMADRMAAPVDGLILVPGGPTRAASVACGLAAAPDGADKVLIHDAARPLVSPETISADYNYAHYSEYDIPGGKLASGSTSQRYEIDLHQIHLLVPVGSRWDVGLDLAYETMSGATPWYIEPEAGSNKPLQVMSGATIEDARTDVLAVIPAPLESEELASRLECVEAAAIIRLKLRKVFP